MKKYLIAGSSLLVFASASARAEAQSPAAGDQVVVADRISDDAMTILVTGSPLRTAWTAQPVTVFTSRDIDTVQGPDLTRLLEQAPGVSIVRNGGLGAQTSLFVRGASSEQTLVLLDGVRLTDVASPSGGTDLGTLALGSLGKVELLRGSNSVVWGSDAIGGVLALTSRRFTGVSAHAEGGSFGTFDGDATAGVADERGALSLTGGYTTTRGISAAAGGAEPDGYRQWRVAGSGEARLTDQLSLVATARYARGHLDIDGFPAPAFTFADTPEYQVTRQGSGRAGLRWRSEALDLDAGYALSDTRRAYYDPTFGSDPNFTTTGRSERGDLVGRVRLPHDLALDFGADSERTRFETLFDAARSARLTSGHALLGLYTEALTIAGGVRVDHHSRFGTRASFGANAALRLADGLRLTASYGEGFKAPTLYQLYSNFGNEALRPERSRSYDAGLSYATADGSLHAGVTAFRRDSRNLIDFVSCFGVVGGICVNRPFGTYDNVGRARAEGVEAELALRPATGFEVSAAYTWLKATNRTPSDARRGLDLARRPRTTLSLAADWTPSLTGPVAGLKLGADLRLVSRSFDDSFDTVRLGGYQLATLRAELPLGGRLVLFGRIENLFDEAYQTAAGYGTAGRSAYGGVRVSW